MAGGAAGGAGGGLGVMRALLLALALALAGCAIEPSGPVGERLTPEQARSRITTAIPKSVADRAGWAADIQAAFFSLDLSPSLENVCAVVAVIEQESGFRADPTVPNLPAIVEREIERQREKAGIPKLVLEAALALPSTDGRSYGERLRKARTERELSEAFEDFVGRVPLGQRLLADRNPVRTGGPMQVSVAFAKRHVERRPYPYPVAGTLRGEVFTRRGGIYFGVAHLLDYPAPYDDMVYRFADFNAGHYASRNAAFQKAVSALTGVPLDLDGDLVDPSSDKPGATESAVRVLGARIDLSASGIRRDLERESEPAFEKTRLWERVFRLADDKAAAPRAVIPQIKLHSPKITRALTTEWFAKRVRDRHRQCLLR